MKPALIRWLPLLTSAAALAVVFGVALWNPQWLALAEAKTYDWRVRMAMGSAPVATNLGFVFMSDDSITRLSDGSLGNDYGLKGFRYGLYWPRHLYGRVVDELTRQGARLVAFDVLMPQLRPDHAPVLVPSEDAGEVERFLRGARPEEQAVRVGDQVSMESDDYFAWESARSGRVVLAAEKYVLPAALFRTNALVLGDVSADRDADGVLRRARPYKIYREWHPAFRAAAAQYGVDLARAIVRTNQIILSRPGAEPAVVSLDRQGRFDVTDFVGENLPSGWERRGRPYSEFRVWHMGVVVAAQALGLDLNSAYESHDGTVLHLPGPNGSERVVPLDEEGCLVVNWAITPQTPALFRQSIDSLIEQQVVRTTLGIGVTNEWQGRLVFVGSTATGNDLTDRGPTPLGRDSLLVGQHWNIANSVLQGSFVRQVPLDYTLCILVVMGALTATLTWKLRAVAAAVSVFLLTVGYIAAACWIYIGWRIWIPIALPVVGAILLHHVCLVTYRAIFEEREKRKVRAVFSKVVSPDVVHELLGSEKIAFGGQERELTVLFSDVRGFTQLTDRNRAFAENYIREHNLDAAAAAACLDHQARETLNTVNIYLAAVADVIKQHKGTLDKYIGDCVMAFWGAPIPNPQHAVAAVKAAVDAQRAIHALNVEREAENQRRERERAARAAAGLEARPPLALLSLGSGVNSGNSIVGLMGSDKHILNYTVFGREVNLASRLEGVSGRGRIVIGHTTYDLLRRDAPELAARCVELGPTSVKGIAENVKCYEVPWREDAAPAPLAAEHVAG